MARDRGGRSTRRARSSRRDRPEGSGDAPEAASGRDRSKGRSARKGRGKKKLDLMPIIMVVMLVAAGGGAAAYFPLQKRTLRQAVSAGGRTGFDAARELSKSPPEAEFLYRVVESSASGRMAAASGLALMIRRAGDGRIVGAIQKRLKAGVPADALAAYAAALAQSRTKAGETAAAVVVASGAPEAKRAAVRGLAGGTTDEAAQAVGRAMGETDSEVRALAEAAVADWVSTAPEKAARAAAAALAIDNDGAQIAAAKVMLAASRGIEPEQLLPLLSNDSAEVRELGLRAAMASGALRGGNEALTAAAVELVDVDDQPPGVKVAALEAVAAGGLEGAGPGALEILERDPDPEVRVKAALAIGAVLPEGAWEALVAPLLQDDAPRDLLIACLEALSQRHVAPLEKLGLVADALLRTAEGDDETLSGLALIALSSVTNKRDVKYNASQWRTLLARLSLEARLYAEAREFFSIKKKEYEEKKDDPDAVDAIAKGIKKVGLDLQNKVIDGASADFKEKLQDLRDEMKRFMDRIKGK